ncbi:MAG TPA: META domain-containing protein, partial [Promineifilum sp.]|nr:META domain-containing protein [Promineifilum sp.]
MSTYHEGDEANRRRVIAAGVILALQIIGLLWLLLFARDRFALGAGQEPPATAAPTAVVTAVATAVAAAESEPTATPEDNSAATAAAADAAATADADATVAAGLTATDAGVVAPEDVHLDTSGLPAAPDWLAQLVEGSAPDATAGTAGMPPHLLLTFPDAQEPALELTTPDLSRPQVRIVPIAALLAWLQARGDTAGQNALKDLQSLLADPPPADEAVVPPLPFSDLRQPLVARVVFAQFGGGHGVGYVAHMTGDKATPVTADSGLLYVYQGLTDDGRNYVFMSWPMDAAFLGEDADAAATAVAADADAYYDTVAAEIATADDANMTTTLSRLGGVVRSLAVGRAAVEAAAQATPVIVLPRGVTGTPADATGFVWNWTSSRGGEGDETPVANPPDYALVFWPDGSFTFVADCNVGRGSYTLDDLNAIRLTPGAMTRAACPPGSQADAFVQALADTRTMLFDESGDMILVLADGREAVFANAGPADSEAAAAAEAQPDAADAGFTGLNLQWPGFTDASGDVVAVDNPEDYALALLPDGTFTFRADCNVGTGTYTYEDGVLTLVPGAMTLVACPAGSQADAFMDFLGGVSGVTVAGDGAVTMTTANGRSATFISAGPVAAPEEEAAATPAPEAGTVDASALRDVAWQWIGLSAADGTLTEVADPERYTFALLEDGSYAFVADCNRGAGSYTLDGTALTLAPGPVTTAACAAGSGNLGEFSLRLAGTLAVVHGLKAGLGEAPINRRPNGHGGGFPSG